MNEKTISTAKLEVKHIPAVDASVEELIRFAHTFNGYDRWGSFERCAEIANARDHSTIDTLRTCLFIEARRWRHSGETPDEDAIRYWRLLVMTIRERLSRLDALTPEWLASAIRQLPSDASVPPRTQGYNHYTTQKDHWLGWLDPSAGSGSYPRRTGNNVSAKTVYNRIGEPKMLWWLARAARVDQRLLDEANVAVDPQKPLSSQCAEFRNLVPWRTLAESLELTVQSLASDAATQHALQNEATQKGNKGSSVSDPGKTEKGADQLLVNQLLVRTARRWNIPREMALAVLARDICCVYCGREFGEPQDRRAAWPSWEHIVNDVDLVNLENIALCCVGCNASKGTRELSAWLNSRYCRMGGIGVKSMAPVALAALKR